MAAEKYEGKPCTQCGAVLRYRSNSKCVACNGKNKTARQKAIAVAATRRWQERNKDRVSAVRRKRWVEATRYKSYGITRDHFLAMLSAQNGQCEGCCDPLDGGRGTHIDHDHQTGKVRGLLCSRCNQAIGLMRENVETVLRLGVYLEKHRG